MDNYLNTIYDNICDVQGVKVGHVTVTEKGSNTGVTAIIPPGGNLFDDKLLGACHVINGYGKSAGLIQVEEMGTVETPILMTNTLAVGNAMTGLIEYMLKISPDIGTNAGTVNPIVLECNDGYINDIREIAITSEHVEKAIEAAKEDFSQGSVGAGKGMRAYGLKGGIGSASESVIIEGNRYTIGIILNSNFGSLSDLLIYGESVGEMITESEKNTDVTEDKGSLVAVLATDLPISSRQLKRVLKRVQNGIARTGSYTGSGSGDICVGFTTANRINRKRKINNHSFLSDDVLNAAFKATVLATERAVLKSMVAAETTEGINGTVKSLEDKLKELGLKSKALESLKK
ncbi:MAG: P1 family peptidase [Clostridiaceae bacterium]